MTILVVAGRDSGLPESESLAPGSRAVAALEVAISGGAVCIVLRSSRTGEARPALTIAGLEREVWISDDQLFTGPAVDGLVRETRPSGIVAIGVDAALAVGQLTTDVPCWIDFPGDVFGDDASRRAPWGEDAERWRAHRLLWALERADGLSCSDDSTAERLLVALSLRMTTSLSAYPIERFRYAREADGFRSWIVSPARRTDPARILSRHEIGEFARTQRLENELRRIASRPSARAARSLAGSLGRVRKVVRGAAESVLAMGMLSELAMRALARRVRADRESWHAQEPAVDVSEMERRLGRRPRLLVVMPYRLIPPRHGGAVRLLGQFRHLADRCDLHVLRFDQRGESRVERQELEKFCERVDFHHWVVPPRTVPAHERLPPSAWVFADEYVHSRVRRWVETEGIDVVQFECAEMGQFLPAARPAGTVLVEYDIAFRSLERRSRIDLSRRFADGEYDGTGFLDRLRLFTYETACLRTSDVVHVMSREDAAAIGPFVPDAGRRVRVIPNAIAIPGGPRAPARERRGVLLIGNFEHRPNLDALEWFTGEIWPRVRSRRPEAELSIAGAKLPDSAGQLSGRNGVTVLGEVGDIGALYAGHRVLVVPLRAGSGTRLKILEAFAAGTAVVSTSLGAEGLDVENGVHLEIADSPEEFAAAVARLLSEPERADALASSAAARVREAYDVREVSRAAYASILELAVSGARSESRGRPASRRPGIDVSVILPVKDGGAILHRTLEAIRRQQIDRVVEIVCVDSGSSADARRELAAAVDRLVEIEPAQFNHGTTRDLGASVSSGSVLVFLNQDAVPVDERWLERLTAPLFFEVPPAAVQGGILEFPATDREGARRFYWDSGGPRFNFTRESRDWISRHGGIGFSTVNCSIRRDVWERIPFGWIPILEDKAWQRAAREREERIVAVPEAAVYHTHGYEGATLWRRSAFEGSGWRWVGERYSLAMALRDALSGVVWRDWWSGFRRGELRSFAELSFPFLRPLGLWAGNRRTGRLFR